MQNRIDKIKHLYTASIGKTIEDIQHIPVAGSQRSYYRIFSNNTSVVAAFGNNIDENKTFLYFTAQFAAQNIAVPQILAVSDDCDCYIMSDLGNESLLDFVANHSNKPDGEAKIRELYQQVLTQLITMQITAGKTIDYTKCFARQSFDKQQMQFDLNYFKYYFLKLTELPFHEQKLEKDFETFVRFIGEESNPYFMYRDFQARNIFLQDGKPWFIDYQGGMRGPLHYDVASLLYQSRADLSEPLRHALLMFYVDALNSVITIDKSSFIEKYHAIVLLRTLQTLGAYGFRGIIQKKTLFLDSIPQSLAILHSISNKLRGKVAVPYLFSVIDTLKDSSIIGL